MNEPAAIPLHAVMTPATALFVEAVRDSDWSRTLQLLDHHWAEIWFAVDPTDLRRLAAAAPPHLLASLLSAGFIARATGHSAVEDLLEPTVPDRGASPDQHAQYVADLRVRGRPVRAMAHVRRHFDEIQAQRGLPADSSGGTTALWLVQAAITALLAGEAAAAKGMLLSAVDTRRPDRFPFIVREAMAKLALAHALTGDITEATSVNERAQALPRTESWVESLVDATIRLTEYICAVDTLDPRAEELRRDSPSPMAHREFWPVALSAQVRHLVLTGRPHQAQALCDSVAAAGLPPPGADGLFAAALPDARLLLGGRGARSVDMSGGLASTCQRRLARAVQLFTTGQFAAVARLEPPESHDDRVVRAMSLLRAQATSAKGRVREGRRELLGTLHEMLDRRSYSELRYLTRESLEAIRDSATGRQAAELVERLAVPRFGVRAVLAAPLTDAEVDVLRLLRLGLTREEMAERLFVSVNTVKTHLRSAYRKLGATRRNEALEKFADLGI